MIHGTGYYWERVYKADLKKTNYFVIVNRLRYYYYEDMSDDPNPTSINTDDFEIEITNHLNKTIKTGSINKKTARRIWKNLKEKDISFESCESFFERWFKRR